MIVLEGKNEENVKMRSTTTPPFAKDYNDIGNELYIGGKTIDETDNGSSKLFKFSKINFQRYPIFVVDKMNYITVVSLRIIIIIFLN